jgi:hypothetical protein
VTIILDLDYPRLAIPRIQAVITSAVVGFEIARYFSFF